MSGFGRTTAGVMAAAIVVLAAAAWFWLHRPAPPNVIAITIDTLRADHLGSYGDRDAVTPTLDALAGRGVRFADAVAHAPLTLPSHASLFTGLTPARHGIRNNPEFALGESIPTLAERFRAAGYDTAAFVSGFPLSRRFGLGRGFDLYDDQFPRGDVGSAAPYTERRADATTTAARAWLGRGTSQDRKPYFLWVHLFDPHRPYDPPQPFRDRFREKPYDGEIAFVDAEIGKLLTAVGDPEGNRTIIAVTADYGEGLDEHGEPTHGLFIYNSTIRVPLILAGPGVPRSQTIETLVRLIDVTPTLLDLAHLPPLPGTTGGASRLLKGTGTLAPPNRPTSNRYWPAVLRGSAAARVAKDVDVHRRPAPSSTTCGRIQINAPMSPRCIRLKSRASGRRCGRLPMRQTRADPAKTPPRQSCLPRWVTSAAAGR